MSWYCDVAPGHPFHGAYHENEYGFPMTDEAALLERMALEIFQAGLSWLIVLKKRPTTVTAFQGFDVDTVAAYGEDDVARLLGDAGIIRNRRKVAAYLDPVCEVVQPVDVGLFAGVMDYSKLPFILRLMMKKMKSPEGDFRDWEAIRAWAGQVHTGLM